MVSMNGWITRGAKGLCLIMLAGCAATSSLVRGPEFDQKVVLMVPGDYQLFQATRSGYDVGDLQSFHSQHTFPILIEDAFKEIFGSVEVVQEGANLEMLPPEVPAVFEVRMLDLANDIYNEADSYRAVTTLAVAMKSPRGHIFWQKAFRGDGYVVVDPQYSTGLGPQDAVIDAVRSAIDQMQEAIVKSPEVSNQLKYYAQIDQARREKEAGL